MPQKMKGSGLKVASKDLDLVSVELERYYMDQSIQQWTKQDIWKTTF